MSQTRQTTLPRRQRRPDFFPGLIKLAACLPNAEAVQLLTEAARHYPRAETIVPVVGHFSAGKSTFVNTVVGKDIQDVGAQPTTASFTEIRGGSPVSHELRFGIRRIWARLQADLARQSPVEVNEEAASLPESLVRRRYTNHPQWPSGLVLVDTPGLEAAEQQYDAATWHYLESADACIYFITVTSPLTEADQRAIQRLVAVVPRILIVLSKADTVNPSELEQVQHYVTQTLSEWVGQNGPAPTVLPIRCDTRVREKDGQAEDDPLAPWRVVTWVREEVMLQQQLRVERLALDLQRAGAMLRNTLAVRQQAEIDRCQQTRAARIDEAKKAAATAKQYRLMLRVVESRLSLLAEPLAKSLKDACVQWVHNGFATLSSWLAEQMFYDRQRLRNQLALLLDASLRNRDEWLTTTLTTCAQTVLKDFPCSVAAPPVVTPKFLPWEHIHLFNIPDKVKTHEGTALGAIAGLLIGGLLLGALGAIIGAFIGAILATSENDWRNDLFAHITTRLPLVEADVYREWLALANGYLASVKNRATEAAAPFLTAATQTAEKARAATAELKRVKKYWKQWTDELRVSLDYAEASIRQLRSSSEEGLSHD